MKPCFFDHDDGNVQLRYEKALEALDQFRILFSSIRQHSTHVQSVTGMRGLQLWALFHIDARPGISVNELSRALAIHQSTASNLTKNLEKLGAVAKQRGTDKRAVRLNITSTGRVMLSDAPRPLVLQQALQQLSIPELSALELQLKRLIELTTPAQRTPQRSISLSEVGVALY